MDHICSICHEIIKDAEKQQNDVIPGDYLSCKKHRVQVANLNVKLREIQQARIDSETSLVEKLVSEMKELKRSYGVEI